MAYIREHWEDSPSTATSINARRLNHIEGGIEDNDQRITVLEGRPLAHKILDKIGSLLTQRGKLQFTGIATVTDNAPSDKTVVNIPSSLSAYTNDAGFIDSTVNNLVNYYKKTETYTQAEVNALISAIVTLNILVVQTLPTQDISTTTIYLVPKATAETQDVYDEYIYVNNAWEHIGSTQVDLTNYYTKTETDALLADKVDKVAGKQLSTEDFTSALKSKLEGIEAGADSVSWTQIQQTGQKIAEIDINGNTQDVYAPQGGGGSYTEGDGINITNDEISVDTAFTEASTRANIASGDTLSTIWGKIKKFFSDLKNHAFTALDTGSIDIGGMAGGQQYVYAKGVNDFSYNNGVIQISKRTGYNSYDTELIPVPNSNDYVAKTGDTMSGTLNMNTTDGVAVNLRPNYSGYDTTISYQTAGNEACVFATKNAVTSWIFINGEDSVTNHANTRWQSLTPALQIKNNKVAIGKLIANGVTPTYDLEVKGACYIGDQGLIIKGRAYNGGDDEGLVVLPASNGYAAVILGSHNARRVYFCLPKTGNPFIMYNNGSTGYTITIPSQAGTMALTSDIPTDYASSLRIEAQGSYRFQYNLYAKSGAILSSGQVTISTSSRKFKKNIAPLSEDDARKILDVETVTFDYKKDHDNYTSRKGYKNIGCIAEDVNEIIPEVVIEDENDEIFGINYIEMIPYLIKMVQIQQKEIEELKAIIKANE